MEVSDRKIREITRRILISRMRLLCNNGFYGLLLMHMKISLSNEHDTAWTDSKERIFFNPEFVDLLSDRELDYVLMHEVVHAALRHCFRIGNRDNVIFNLAADIVVNSNILLSNNGNESAIELRKFGGVQMHLAPDGREGYEYTVEELYAILEGKVKIDRKKDGGLKGRLTIGEGKNIRTGWDIHIASDCTSEEAEANRQMWEKNIRSACQAIAIRDPSKQRGLIPMFAQRYINELTKAKTDWRQLLNEFVQDEVNDYSFTPPDRRMDGSEFFLPDYNEKDYKPEKILFMIDTSGSMSDQQITECYSEIKGAIDQFNGHLEGLLGFFDAEVIPPEPFEDEDELLIIKPKGGGGTSFQIIFDYIKENMEDELPKTIVILTDGCAPWPSEEAAMNIPVLWIINNESSNPPWGMVARIV